MHTALASTLKIEEAERGAELGVILRGALDIETAQEFRKRVRAALDRGLRDFVIDLREVWFCDATGGAALVGLLQRVREQDGTLRLLLARGSVVLKVLNRLGVEGLFSITEQ